MVPCVPLNEDATVSVIDARRIETDDIIPSKRFECNIICISE